MKNKKKVTTPTEQEPKQSKGKKKSSSQQQPPPPPPVRAPVNGSTTAVKQADPVVTFKPTIPDEADFNLPQHTPSYVGISCAILGYGLYNRYNGSPGPSLQISSQQIGGTSQPSDELDSTGPVTRLIAQFEALKKEQAAKAAAEHQALRSLEEVATDQGDFIPTLSPPREAPVKKYPPVITETKKKSEEKIIETQKPQPEARTPQVVEKRDVVEERTKLVDEIDVVKDKKVAGNIVEDEEKTAIEIKQHDDVLVTRVVETLMHNEGSHVNEDIVVTTKSPEHFEQIAAVENIVSEEDQEDVSLLLSESKSEHSQLVLTQSPVFEERSDSDTGSVRIHDTPEPFESHQELSFDTHLQYQQSSSPLLTAQSPEQEIMKQEFPENAQMVTHGDEETVEDELSTRVQVSDSNEEALMREAPIESTSSRKTSIESDAGSNEVLARDGKWFLSQYELVCDEVRRRVTQAESDLEKFSDEMNEDVEGRVRAGIGKANLLITSKLKQFHDLCIKNIENSMTDGCETKIEDLEGFWEMVSYQIEDVHHTFDEIESMRQNDWTVVAEADIQRHELPKTKPKSKKSSSSLPAEDEAATAAKEEARKARLREAKRLQANKLAAAKQDDVIIFAASPDETVSSSGVSDPIVTVQTEQIEELIEIESSTLISVRSERLPQQQESESVPVDLLS